MTRYLSVFIFLACSVWLSAAQKPDTKENVRKAFRWLMKDQRLSRGDQKELAFTLIEDFPEVNELLGQVQKAGAGQASARAGDVLRSLQNERSQSEIHGATFGWYLVLDGQKFQTLPLVIQVREGSPAAKSGLLPGDVIDQCQGKNLKSASSRNQLLLFLSRWPESQPIELKIRRGQVAEAEDNRLKNQKKTVLLIFD